MSGDTMDVRELAAIKKLLKGELPKIKIGILGSSKRDGGKLSNAEVGAAHEFGTDKLPRRSFLRVPIADKLDKELESSGLLNKETLLEVVRQKSVRPWFLQIAVVAEKIVQDAFATGGFGKWASHKPGYENNTGMILVDTQQLRDSITTEVK